MKASTIAILAFALGLFLTAIAWPQTTITGSYLGIDLDKVGTLNLTVDGKLDNHIKLTNIKSAPVDVKITDDSIGVWEHPFNGKNWEILIVVSGTNADLWFAVFNPSKFFNVTLTYADKTTNTLAVPVGIITTSGLLGQVAIATGQLLCSVSYVNQDASTTAIFWSGVPPCPAQVNAALLKITYPANSTICAQPNSNGGSDLWLSKIIPCVHP